MAHAQVLSTKSVGQCSSGSVTKLQDEVHKLERTADTLRAGKQEAEKQLQVRRRGRSCTPRLGKAPRPEQGRAGFPTSAARPRWWP